MRGLEDLIYKNDIDCLVRVLKDAISGGTASVKIDGSPALILWSEYPGLDGPGVAFKWFPASLRKGTEKYFTSGKSIDDFIDAGNLERDEKGRIGNEGLRRTLKNALGLASIVPGGRMIQGDVLFGTADSIQRNGEVDWVKPNTLSYEFQRGTLEGREFGMVIHTEYDGDVRDLHQSTFDGELNAPHKFFLMTSSDLEVKSGSLKKYGRIVDQIGSELKSADDLLSKKDFVPKLRRAVTDAQLLGKDFEAGDVMNALMDSKSAKFVEENREGVEALVGSILEVQEIKSLIMKELEKSTPFRTLDDGAPTSGEGFVVMDKTGPVKLVDDADFTRKNLIAHGSNRMEKLTEEISTGSGDTMMVYTSSKDSELYRFVFRRELKFGNNAGLNYGFGTYAVTERPGGDAGAWSEGTRSALYGDNVYEFSLDTDRFVFLLWGEYLKTKRAKELDSSEQSFIKDQLEALGIKLPEPDVLRAMYETKEVRGKGLSNAGAAELFYRHMANVYYQNPDGTLNTPINGFVYRGSNDGITAVIWNPYAMRPSRVSHDGGRTWEPMGRDHPDYGEYVESVDAKAEQWRGGFSEEKASVNKNRIFDGHPTPEKERAYRALMNYGASRRGAFLGNWTDVVIHDDGTVDATYKSNNPQVDGGRHFYRAISDDSMDALADSGFGLGTVNAGIKFGSESSSGAHTIYDCPGELLPKRVTGGIKLVNHGIDGLNGWAKRIGEKTLDVDYCEFLSFDGLDGVGVKLNPDKPSYTKLEKKPKWAKDLLTEDPRSKKNKKSLKSLNEETIMNNIFEKVLREKGPYTEEEQKTLSLETADDLKKEFSSKRDIVEEFGSKLDKNGVFLAVPQADLNSLKKKYPSKATSEKSLTLKSDQIDDDLTDDLVDKGGDPFSVKFTSDSSKIGQGVGNYDYRGKGGFSLESDVYKALVPGATYKHKFEKDSAESILQNQVSGGKKESNLLWKNLTGVIEEQLIKSKAQKPDIDWNMRGVYFTNQNKTIAEAGLNRWIHNLKGFSGLKKILGINYSNFKKADLVVSFKAGEGSAIYIPISAKTSMKKGNGGERGAGYVSSLISSKIPKLGSSVSKENIYGFIKKYFDLSSSKRNPGFSTDPVVLEIFQDILLEMRGTEGGYSLYCTGSKDNYHFEFYSMPEIVVTSVQAVPVNGMTDNLMWYRFKISLQDGKEVVIHNGKTCPNSKDQMSKEWSWKLSGLEKLLERKVTSNLIESFLRRLI